MLLEDVKPIHCQMIMNQMADAGYRTSTIYQTRVTLFNMLDYAYQNDVIMKNSCNAMVKSNIGKPSNKKEALTLEQQKRFVNGIAGNTYELQYKFLLQTGLRTGEMIGLKWSDVDFKKRTITVNRSMEYRHSTKGWRIGEPKSQSGYRTIPLTDDAVTILKKRKNSTYDTMLFKLCDKIGVPRFSMHVLRHTFATRCIEGGMKPKTLQTILGHYNIGITMNLYVHTTEDEKYKEIEKIAESLKVV